MGMGRLVIVSDDHRKTDDERHRPSPNHSTRFQGQTYRLIYSVYPNRALGIPQTADQYAQHNEAEGRKQGAAN